MCQECSSKFGDDVYSVAPNWKGWAGDATRAHLPLQVLNENSDDDDGEGDEMSSVVPSFASRMLMTRKCSSTIYTRQLLSIRVIFCSSYFNILFADKRRMHLEFL